MRFQTLLQIIYKFHIGQAFDTRAASISVLGYLATSESASPREKMGQAEIKRVSTGLDRLFKMGFLKRERASRIVKTSTGKPCRRGYCYLYRLSKQGLQYLDYLENPVKTKIAYKPRDIYDAKFAERVRAHLPEGLKDRAEEICKEYFDRFEEVGRYKRFPRKGGGKLALFLSEFVRRLSKLEEENARLENANTQLLKELKLAIEENGVRATSK